MEDRDDIHVRKGSFDFKAFWGCNIFKVNSLEVRCQVQNCLNSFFRSFSLVDADWNHIGPSEGSEEKGLSFHYRQSGSGSNISITENCGPISYDRTDSVVTFLEDSVVLCKLDKTLFCEAFLKRGDIVESQLNPDFS